MTEVSFFGETIPLITFSMVSFLLWQCVSCLKTSHPAQKINCVESSTWLF